MNSEILRQFVAKYVETRYQERLLYEFGSDRKRANALSRFSHDAEAVLKKSVSKTILTKTEDVQEKDQSVHVISWDEKDGKTLALCEALRYFEASYMSVILIGKDFALIKEETEKGSAKILYLR